MSVPGTHMSSDRTASLDQLRRTRPVRAGDRILMVGVGAGMSAGAVLVPV